MQNKAVARTNVGHRVLQRPQGSAGAVRKWPKARSRAHETIVAVSTKDECDDLDTKQLYAGKRALIVGAGPAGSVNASFLAKRGFFVDVFEKREDLTQVSVKGKRTVLITLQRASIDVLKAAGIGLPENEHDFFDGIHHYSGLAYLQSDGEMVCQNAQKGRFLAERQDLARHIMAAAREENPERIRLHFSRSCISVDLAKQEVKFQCPDNEIIQQAYDLLIGSDGIDSEVRKAMERGVRTFDVYSTPSTLFYKSYRDVVVDEDSGVLFH